MNLHRPSCAVVGVLIATQMLGPAVLWAADQRGIRVEANRRMLVSGISGEQLTLTAAQEAKPLHFRDAVNVGDQLATGNGTMAEVLVGNRAVVILDHNTTAHFTTMSDDQTTIQVSKGVVRVAASAVALGEQGKITVQTPTGQVQMRGGIVRVMVDQPAGATEHRPIGEARPYRASYSPNPTAVVAALTPRSEIIQVEEGSAEIAGAGGKAVTVQAGQAVTMQAGQAGPISKFVNQESMRPGVVATAGHSQTPKEGLDNLVALQVEQATQLGNALTGAAETGKGEAGRKDHLKNVINGATGGVTLAGLLSLIFQPTAPTSGTLTFRNSNFTVSGSLATVEAAQTDSFRDSSDRVVPGDPGDANASPPIPPTFTNINAPTTKLTLNDFKGQAGSFATDGPTGVIGEIYRVTAPNEVTGSSGRDARFALQAMILNSSDNGNTSPVITFSDGVNVVNSTVTADGSSLILVIGRDASLEQTPTINFNNSAFSSSSSKLGGAIEAVFSATGGAISEAGKPNFTVQALSPTNSLVRLVDTTATIQRAVDLDSAILLASAPLVSLYGTIAGDPANNKTKIITNGDFASLTNSSRLSVPGSLPTDALASLNAATLVVKGNFLTLGAGSSVTVSTLAYLTNQSIFQVQGALVNFNGGGSELNIMGSCGGSCQTIGTGIPVLLTGGATLANNVFTVADGYNAFTGSNAPALSEFANKPLLSIDGAGNTVNLGL